MKNILIIAVIAILIACMLVFSGIVPLELVGGEDYNTGISRDTVHNCETIIKKGGIHDFGLGAVGGWAGNVPVEEGTEADELIMTPLNNGPVVTAMKTGGKSISVTIQGTLGYGGISTIYWVPEWGWYTVEYTTNGRNWETIINTKDNQIDQSIVTLFSGPRNKQKYYREDPGFEIRHPFYPTIVYEYKILKSIAFQITDTHVGAIRVKQMTEFSALFGALHDTMTMSIDYAYLASGTGDVEIVDKATVYEEGETIKFKADTGFSGQAQGGIYTSKGWELKIYDSSGNLKKKWDIDDDKRDTRYDSSSNILNYQIPSGAYQSDGSNTWKAVLTNTLFDQDEELFFTVGVGMKESGPSVPTITFDKDEYNMGDTVYVTLESTPNPEGRNKVDGFLINAFYGTDGVDYIENYKSSYLSANGNSLTFSFRVSKGDMYLSIEAWAFDAPEDSGGIPSEKSQTTVWIKDKESSPIEFDYTGLIVAAIIIIIFGIIALLVPGAVPVKFAVFLVGLGIAIFTYAWFFTNWF